MIRGKLAVTVVFVMLTALLIVTQDRSAWAGSPSKEMRKGGHIHRMVTGEIVKITGDAVELETTEGTKRNISMKEIEREGIRNLKPGHRLILEMDEGNQIVDIDRIGEDGSLEHEEEHAWVSGEVLRYDRVKQSVTLKTNKGTSRTLGMKEAAATKMNAVKAGTKVILEVDEENGMVNDFVTR